jgi:hypothetical protein
MGQQVAQLHDRHMMMMMMMMIIIIIITIIIIPYYTQTYKTIIYMGNM